MTRIIIASSPIHAHVLPLHAIAQAMAQRGHAVTFLTGPQFGFVEQGCVAFVPLDTTAAPTATAQDAAIAAIPAQHHALQAILATPDHQWGERLVLLHDTSFLGAWPVLLGAPGMRPDSVIGLGVVPLPRAGTSITVQERLQDVLDTLHTPCGAPLLQGGLLSLPDRYLQLSAAHHEDLPAYLPPGLQFIGALPAHDAHSVDRNHDPLRAIDRAIRGVEVLERRAFNAPVQAARKTRQSQPGKSRRKASA